MRSNLRIISILACAGAVFSASNANARDSFPRWYIGLVAGGTIMQDFDGNETYNSLSTGMLSASGTQGSEAGYSYGAQIGYVIPGFEGLRLEGEVLISQNNSSSGFSVAGITDNTGEIKRTAYMLNALYDFSPESVWSPYLGIGGGVSSINFGFDDDTVLAGQALAGINISPANMPNLTWSLGYRLMVLDGAEMSATSINAIAETASETGKYDSTITHSAELGLKMRF